MNVVKTTIEFKKDIIVKIENDVPESDLAEQ